MTEMAEILWYVMAIAILIWLWIKMKKEVANEK